MGELEVSRLEKLQFALLTTTRYGEAPQPQDFQKKQGSSEQWTLLLLSRNFSALVEDWQKGNTFSAFSFIFLCSSVHSFYHVTSYEKDGTKD